MKLSMMNQADVGEVFQTTGTVRWVGKPRHITGEKNGKPYDFWGQFFVIAEGDDSVGVDTTFNSQDDCMSEAHKGAELTVKGKVDEYTKDGKTQRKLARAKILTKNRREKTQGGNTKHNGDAKRSFALAYGKDVTCAMINNGLLKDAVDIPDTWESLANKAQRWLEGKAMEERTKTPPTNQETTQPPVDDGNIPF